MRLRGHQLDGINAAIKNGGDVNEAIQKAVLEAHGIRPKTITDLQNEIAIWAEATFPGQTVQAKIKHLAREVQELLESPTSREELADCLNLLLHIARMTATSADEMVACGFVKLEICKRRKWKPADTEGIFQHEEQS